MDQLADQERKFLAFALQSMAMRVGPSAIPLIMSVVEKLGIQIELEYFLKDWIAYAARHEHQTCSRCGSELNNVAPGFSVVAGGQTVCTPCLLPGEEILRARSI